ncbi:MAG TPA: zinc ribbon domain-containing protein [Microbacteriaceae bacterium]|nr:zinc ribbon domain-containing protein [Microbacteriaceae bacterium]
MIEIELAIQQCEQCGHRMFPERLACSRCGSSALLSQPAGPGTVCDRVDVYRAPSGADDGPTHVVLVELDAGPRLLARAAVDLVGGDRVSVSDEALAAVAMRLWS